MIVFAALIEPISEAIDDWTPTPGQESTKAALQQQIGQAETVLHQWFDEEVAAVDIPALIQPWSEAAQDTLEAVTRAMIEYGYSAEAIQEMMAEVATAFEDVPPDEGEPVVPVSALEILSHQSYTDGDWFHIVGEVHNNSDSPMGFVKVVATLCDDAGNVTGTDYTYTDLDIIPPGGKAPFEAGTDEWAGTTHYKLEAQGQPDDMPRPDVVILSHGYYVDGDWLHVRGEVRNIGTTAAEFVK